MAYDRSLVSEHLVIPHVHHSFRQPGSYFDNALQGAVAGVLDDNYETRT